ncbi:hypothetical protein BC940DRAFT_288307 [Gongronella butleri]|nr:hypothetical protein BC940DRAFT_288307 [Gongronella butleri]
MPSLDARARPSHEDYEYTVYDLPEQRISYYDHSVPVLVILNCHEGFEWNEELFVRTYQKGQGQRHKSHTRMEREQKIGQAAMETRDHVLQLTLSPKDMDVLP